MVNWPNGSSAGGLKIAPDEISFNFIVAGGGANGGALDHDDGSSFYHDHDNFFIYGGHKSDFDGHGKRSYNNLMAFANVYGGRCLSISNLPHDAPNNYFAEGFWNNTCILAQAGQQYLHVGDCVADKTLANRLILGQNKVMVPKGDTSVTCGPTYNISTWLALGLDVGTQVTEVPPTDTIMALAREKLFPVPPAQ